MVLLRLQWGTSAGLLTGCRGCPLPAATHSEGVRSTRAQLGHPVALGICHNERGATAAARCCQKQAAGSWRHCSCVHHSRVWRGARMA